MSAAERVRGLARQIRDEVRSIERRKVRTPNEAERKVLDLLAADDAASDAATAASGTTSYKSVRNVNFKAAHALRDAVRDAASGPFAHDVHPTITAHGLALGLTALIECGDRRMFDAAIELQCATHDRLRAWARRVAREGFIEEYP